MKDSFPGYYPLSNDQMKAFLSDAIIVFDVNALLDLFRIEENQAKTVLKVLKDDKISKRLWIPYDVAWLYHKQMNTEIMNQINNDVAMLSQMDPSIKTLGDVPPEVIQLSMSTNMSIVNAYKVINYGKVSSAKQEAIQQAAINQAKGKQHMTPMNGISTPETGVDIPDSELAMWKETFPDKSMADLKKLYNETL